MKISPCSEVAGISFLLLLLLSVGYEIVISEDSKNQVKKYYLSNLKLRYAVLSVSAVSRIINTCRAGGG